MRAVYRDTFLTLCTDSTNLKKEIVTYRSVDGPDSFCKLSIQNCLSDVAHVKRVSPLCDALHMLQGCSNIAPAVGVLFCSELCEAPTHILLLTTVDS